MNEICHLLALCFVLQGFAPTKAKSAEAAPDIEWQRGFGGDLGDQLRSILETSDGGYILAGSTASSISGNKTSPYYGMSDSWVIKLDSSGNKEWEQSYGGSSYELIWYIQENAGGYILGGSSSSTISGNKTSPYYGTDDYWILQLDATGNKVWEQSCGGTSQDESFGLQEETDGYVLGGWSDSGFSGNKTNATYGGSDFWLVKLDLNRNKIWERSFGGSGNDACYTMQKAIGGGYVLGGESSSAISGNKTTTNYGGSDFWLVKVDLNGNKVWEKSFGGSGNDSLKSLQQTSDGSYILGGFSNSGVSGNKTTTNYGGADYWVIKVDGNGGKQWERTFGGTNDENLYDLRQTTDGGYLLAGQSSSGPSGNKTATNYGAADYWLIKLDASGNKVWEQAYGGDSIDNCYTVRETKDGGYIVGGSSKSGVSGIKSVANYGVYDYWVIKLAPPKPVLNISQAVGNVTLGWSAVIGKTYRVEYKSRLNDPNWTALGGDVLATGNSLSKIDSIGTNRCRFYRLKVL
jgi:hypothetical protein